jgi:hypothetical protein
MGVSNTVQDLIQQATNLENLSQGKQTCLVHPDSWLMSTAGYVLGWCPYM